MDSLLGIEINFPPFELYRLLSFILLFITINRWRYPIAQSISITEIHRMIRVSHIHPYSPYTHSLFSLCSLFFFSLRTSINDEVFFSELSIQSITPSLLSLILSLSSLTFSLSCSTSFIPSLLISSS